MMIAGPVSMIMPRIKNMIVQTLRTDTALVKFATMNSCTAAVACVSERTRPNAVANARTNARPP